MQLLKGTQGKRREGRRGSRARERHAGAGAELSRARLPCALRTAGAAAGRGSEGGDGQRLAAEVGGGRAGCSSAVPGTGITQKAKKKKRE